MIAIQKNDYLRVCGIPCQALESKKGRSFSIKVRYFNGTESPIWVKDRWVSILKRSNDFKN